jgi:thiosulfate/3-mercaptopyruvate sulfurtransferase
MGHCGLVAVAGISPDDLVAAACVIDVEEWIAASSSPYGKDFCPRKGRIQ